MCHMLFTRFIFVRHRPPRPPSFSLSRSRALHLFCSLLSFSRSRVVVSPSSSQLATPPPLRSPAHLAHVAPPFSLLFLSSLLAAISPRYYSLLSFSRLLQIVFPVSLLLATSLILFSAMLASLSSPCLPFRLLVYTLMMRSPPFSFSLAVVRCSSVFVARVLASLFPRVHHCGGTLRFIVSVTPSLSHSRFRLVPPAHLSTHVERYFSPFFLVRPTIFLSLSLSFAQTEGLFPRRRAG